MLSGRSGTTDLVTSLARELQKLEGTLRQRRVGRAVLLVLGPVALLAVLAAVEGDLALATLESAILEAGAGSTTNFLESRHFWLGVSMGDECAFGKRMNPDEKRRQDDCRQENKVLDDNKRQTRQDKRHE
jgi:hypothetical protein